MPAPPARKGKDNVLTRKIGPLPAWAWTAIAAAVVLAWVYLHHAKTTSSGKPAGGRAGGFAASLVPPVVLHGPRGRRGRPGGDDDDDDDDDRKRKHRKRRKHRDDDDDRGPVPRAAARGVPGQAPGPVTGTLQSFTTPQTGVSPSLAQVAAQFNTSPDAIVEEATGRGSPHGALWHRYVAAHDWQAPLPHGTDMTVLAQPQ